MASPKGHIASSDLTKIGLGALMAALGAVLAYFSTQVIPIMNDSDNGTILTIAAVASVLVNSARKWLTDTRGDAGESS